MKTKIPNYSSILFSLLYPFGGLIYSFTKFRAPGAKYGFIIFCAFYGSVLVLHREGAILGQGADMERYALMFMDAHEKFDMSISQFFSQLDDHDRLDFYNPIIVYFLSRLTGNPHVYFMVIGLFFGSFYANNIWGIISLTQRTFNWKNAIFLIVFAFICSFDTIGTVRMHTGFQVFFFGMFSYLTSGNKKRLIWIPLSILIHFSMFYLVALTVIYFLIRKVDSKLLFGFFLVAHVINELDLEFVHRIFSFMPTGVEERLAIYSNEEKIEMLKQSGKFFLGDSNLWARIDSILLRATIFILTTFLFFPKNYYLTKFPKLEPILNFSLLIYGFSLIIANLPSGYRFMTISSMFFFAYYSLLFTNYYFLLKPRHHAVIRLLSPILLIISIKFLRNIFDYTSLFVFIGNFFTSLFFEFNVTIIDSLKKFLH